jgi:hypothetical protein
MKKAFLGKATMITFHSSIAVPLDFLTIQLSLFNYRSKQAKFDWNKLHCYVRAVSISKKYRAAVIGVSP